MSKKTLNKKPLTDEQRNCIKKLNAISDIKRENPLVSFLIMMAVLNTVNPGSVIPPSNAGWKLFILCQFMNNIDDAGIVEACNKAGNIAEIIAIIINDGFIEVLETDKDNKFKHTEKGHELAKILYREIPHIKHMDISDTETDNEWLQRVLIALRNNNLHETLLFQHLEQEIKNLAPESILPDLND